MKLLLTASLVFASHAALADDITCQTINNITSCHSTSTDYSYLHNAGQDSLARAGQGLGQILAGAMSPKSHAVELILGVRCNVAEFAKIAYSDGTVKTFPMEGQVLNDEDRVAVVKAIPIARIVDLYCASP